MKKNRNIFRVCVCLLLLFLAGGCGTVKKECSDLDTRQNDAEPVTIRFAWWGEQERAEKTKEALELFMEKSPDILVQAVSFPYETYHENMEIFIETGYMPDVWQGYVGSKNEYMDAGLVEALDTYVSSGLISVDDISEHLLETGKIDGKLYGLSLGCNVKCMVVIPEYFRKAGIRIPEYGYESWEALETDLLMIKEGCDIPVAGNVFNRDFTFEYFCQQRGERKFKNADVPIIGFSKKTYVDYYEMWMRWEEAGLVPAYMENYMDRSQPVSEEDKPL